jgi:hypothetical protein
VHPVATGVQADDQAETPRAVLRRERRRDVVVLEEHAVREDLHLEPVLDGPAGESPEVLPEERLPAGEAQAADPGLDESVEDLEGTFRGETTNGLAPRNRAVKAGEVQPAVTSQRTWRPSRSPPRSQGRSRGGTSISGSGTAPPSVRDSEA